MRMIHFLCLNTISNARTSKVSIRDKLSSILGKNTITKRCYPVAQISLDISLEGSFDSGNLQVFARFKTKVDCNVIARTDELTWKTFISYEEIMYEWTDRSPNFRHYLTWWKTE